ncbi:unnamed protein product [Urochloa humidicola]
MNGHLCASPGHSTPQNESILNNTGETVDNQEILSEMDSSGHLNTHVHGASAVDAHDMLSIAELRKKIASAYRNSSDQNTQKNALAVNRAIAEMEQKLGSLRQETQKLANDKENEEAVLRRLQSELSRSKEAHNDAERQFHNVLAELERMLGKS